MLRKSSPIALLGREDSLAFSLISSEFGIVWGAREGDNIADVAHPRYEEKETLEAQSKAGMRHCAKATSI